MKLLSLILLPIPLIFWPVLVAVGSVLVGIGYGFGTPLVATFEAVGENRDSKFYHAFVVRLNFYVVKVSVLGLIFGISSSHQSQPCTAFSQTRVIIVRFW